MTEYYKAKRIIYGKPRWVIIDETGNVVDNNPCKDKLKDLKKGLYTGKFRDGINNLRYSDEELLYSLNRFYEKYGRIPIEKDFYNNPEFPGFKVYQKRFGSWQKALKLLGFDIESLTKNGILKNSQQKGRFGEIIVKNHFKVHPVDLAGESLMSHCDGICPNGKIYEVKSSKLHVYSYGNCWAFSTDNKYKEEIEIYYFIGFNEDWTKLEYGWRVPGEIVEGPTFQIGEYGRKFNVGNMEQYDITDKLKDIFEEFFK